MDNYGVAASAIIALILIGVTQYRLNKRSDHDQPLDSAGPDGDFTEQVLEFSPHGQVLILIAPERPRPNALWEKLTQFCDGRMPYAGIIVDCGGRGYRFSSADLGGLASAIAAWVRGWVAPCAIVASGTEARQLSQVLRITKLEDIEELRIVPSVERAQGHVELYLKRRAPVVR